MQPGLSKSSWISVLVYIYCSQICQKSTFPLIIFFQYESASSDKNTNVSSITLVQKIKEPEPKSIFSSMELHLENEYCSTFSQSYLKTFEKIGYFIRIFYTMNVLYNILQRCFIAIFISQRSPNKYLYTFPPKK